MPISLVSEICARISDCVAGRLSVLEFRDWFAPVAWNIERSKLQTTIEFVYRIDGLLAEASSANWSEQDTREELDLAVPPFLVDRKAPRISRPVLNMTPRQPSARRSILALVS